MAFLSRCFCWSGQYEPLFTLISISPIFLMGRYSLLLSYFPIFDNMEQYNVQKLGLSGYCVSFCQGISQVLTKKDSLMLKPDCLCRLYGIFLKTVPYFTDTPNRKFLIRKYLIQFFSQIIYMVFDCLIFTS